MITNISKVVVPVEDQQAALEFWTTTMGSRVIRDDTTATNAGSRSRHPTKTCCWC